MLHGRFKLLFPLLDPGMRTIDVDYYKLFLFILSRDVDGKATETGSYK